MPQSRAVILFVVHSGGGGTIRFAQELADLISDRADVVWAWGIGNKSIHISSRPPYDMELSFDLARGLATPVSALKEFHPSRVNVIQTIGLQEHIGALIDRLALPYDVTFTDYHHFSRAPHFEDENGRYIGDAAVATMARRQRDDVPPLLRHAERRIAISRDLGHRIKRFMPGLPVIQVQVSEPNPGPKMPVKVQPLAANEAMRVLTLGRLSPLKGLATIAAVAKRAESEDFPIEIICLGEKHRAAGDILNTLPRVRVLGGYEQKDFGTIISRLQPHLAWFPFNSPETHSYALSDVMSFGLPVLATAIGAIPERVIGRRSTWLLPFEEADADHFFHWLKRLYADRMQTPESRPSIRRLPPLVKDFYPDRYLQPIFGAGSAASS